MRLYNRDGSEGRMGGNGIRCVAKYLHDSGKTIKDEMTIETASGIKNVKIYTRYGMVAGFCEIGETAEETVAREVMEEVGLKVKNIRYYTTQPWGVDGNLLLGYYCDLDGEDNIELDRSELAMADWFDRHDLPAKDDGISLTREMIRVFGEGREPK